MTGPGWAPCGERRPHPGGKTGESDTDRRLRPPLRRRRPLLHFNGRVSERERATPRDLWPIGGEVLSERTRTENAGKRSGGRTRRHARRGRRPGFHMFARKPHGHFAAATTRDCPRRTGGPRTRGSARASMPRNVSSRPLPDRRLKSPRMKRPPRGLSDGISRWSAAGGGAVRVRGPSRPPFSHARLAQADACAPEMGRADGLRVECRQRD